MILTDDLSLPQWDILPTSMTDRMIWRTSVLHAYGHEWPCQLVYNPRMQLGMGLTDGEGTERLWSRKRKLIGITRLCAVRCSPERIGFPLMYSSYSDVSGSILLIEGLEVSRDRSTQVLGVGFATVGRPWELRQQKQEEIFSRLVYPRPLSAVNGHYSARPRLQFDPVCRPLGPFFVVY